MEEVGEMRFIESLHLIEQKKKAIVNQPNSGNKMKRSFLEMKFENFKMGERE